MADLDKPKGASQLVNDVTQLAGLVGNLGLSIAAAQKAMNVDYVQQVLRLLDAAQRLATDTSANGDQTPTELVGLVSGLLTQLAPPRYQYTETTLDFRVDLAQSIDINASFGLGVNTPVVAVNASLAAGYAYDVQAAAQIRTVINAVPADMSALAPLLARAEKLAAADPQKLPDGSEVDKAFFDSLNNIQAMTKAAQDNAGDGDDNGDTPDDNE